ncbi:MAG: hypothetical protein ACRDGH_08185, partial [Candidatus Limnocylindria bacterium]
MSGAVGGDGGGDGRSDGRTGGETLTRPDKAAVSVGDQSSNLPIVRGREGDDAVDIGQLRSETGLITFDPGYKNTAVSTSAITFLDGEAGILRYRGYP